MANSMYINTNFTPEKPNGVAAMHTIFPKLFRDVSKIEAFTGQNF